MNKKLQEYLINALNNDIKKFKANYKDISEYIIATFSKATADKFTEVKVDLNANRIGYAEIDAEDLYFRFLIFVEDGLLYYKCEIFQLGALNSVVCTTNLNDFFKLVGNVLDIIEIRNKTEHCSVQVSSVNNFNY